MISGDIFLKRLAFNKRLRDRIGCIHVAEYEKDVKSPSYVFTPIYDKITTIAGPQINNIALVSIVTWRDLPRRA